MRDVNVILLAYPDNPIGKVFIDTFLKKGIPIKAVVVEKKGTGKNWKRFRTKVEKDGLVTALSRFLHVLWMRYTRNSAIALAGKNGIPVHRVGKFNSPECADLVKSLDTDILAIASAPILKDFVFAPAKIGCLNAHPGWLPQYRGIGANAYAMQKGDSPGITVHFIDAGIDMGRILKRERIPILPHDSVPRINDRAVARGAELMAEVIHEIQGNRLTIPVIDEMHGEVYKAMPYSEVKKVNQKLRAMGG